MTESNRRKFSPKDLVGLTRKPVAEPATVPEKESTLLSKLQALVLKQHPSDRMTKLADMLSSKFPIEATDINSAFIKQCLTPALYTKGVEYITQQPDETRSQKWADRKVFHQLAPGFLAATLKQEGRNLLRAKNLTNEFLDNVYSPKEKLPRPDGLIIDQRGDVIAATKYLLVPTLSEVDKQVQGFRECISRISDVCFSDPKLIIVSPKRKLDQFDDDPTVEFHHLPLTTDQVLTLGKILFNDYRPDASTPTLREAWQKKWRPK